MSDKHKPLEYAAAGAVISSPALPELMSAIAAAFAILYYGISIYEKKTVQRFLNRWRRIK